MTHIVMFSGGIGSWAAAKRVAEKYGTDDLLLVFTDTKIEDPDLYRFVDEAAANVGGRLLKLAEGRDPWQVFFDVRMMGSSRVDPCSRVLKRDFFKRWLEANYTPDNCVIYMGIDWTERHRIERVQQRWHPWRYEAPMCDIPMIYKRDMIAALEAEGIEPPRLYRLGFNHNNCGGFCVKAGHYQFHHLLRTFPELYAYHEGREQEFRRYVGRDDVAIMSRTVGGKKLPMTMKEFRERIEVGRLGELDLCAPWGGCGCMLDSEEVSNG